MDSKERIHTDDTRLFEGPSAEENNIIYHKLSTLTVNTHPSPPPPPQTSDVEGTQRSAQSEKTDKSKGSASSRVLRFRRTMQFHNRTLEEQSVVKERDIPLRQSPKKYVKESHGFIPAFRKPEQHSLAPGVQSVTPKFSGFHRVYLNMEQDEAQKAWRANKEAQERQSQQEEESKVQSEQDQHALPLQTTSTTSFSQDQVQKSNDGPFSLSDVQTSLQKQASGSLRGYAVGVAEGSLHSQCPSIMEGQTYTSFLKAQNGQLNGQSSNHLEQKNKKVGYRNHRRNRGRKNSAAQSESNQLGRLQRHANENDRPQSACTDGGVCTCHSEHNHMNRGMASPCHSRPNSVYTDINDGSHDHFILMSHNSGNIGALSFDMASVSNYSLDERDGSRKGGEFVPSHVDVNDLKISRNKSVNLHKDNVISRHIDLNNIENITKTQASGEIALIDVGASASQSREFNTHDNNDPLKSNASRKLTDQALNQKQRQSPSNGIGGLLAHHSTVKKLEKITISQSPYARKVTTRLSRCCFCTRTFNLIE